MEAEYRACALAEQEALAKHAAAVEQQQQQQQEQEQQQHRQQQQESNDQKLQQQSDQRSAARDADQMDAPYELLDSGVVPAHGEACQPALGALTAAGVSLSAATVDEGEWQDFSGAPVLAAAAADRASDPGTECSTMRVSGVASFYTQNARAVSRCSCETRRAERKG